MKKYFLKDTSLKNIDDDQFRYQDFANNLRKLIECNETPFNIAIIGKWGLGKSSIVNMALAPLRKNGREFLVCDINAWKYEKEEIGKAFIKELWEGISKHKVLSFNFFHKDYNDIVKKMFEDKGGVSGKNVGLLKLLKYVGITILVSAVAFIAYCYMSNCFYGIVFQGYQFWISTLLRYCKNIGSILIIPLVVWLGKLFMDKLNEPVYKNYEISFPLQTQADYEMYLKNLLQEYYKKNPEKKIIVVIDDLDRLSANKIVEALDALKLFMEYDRFVFIVPFDDEILKTALEQKRIQGISTLESKYDGEMVLDKLFQYKMYLPQLIKYDMRNYAFEICKRDCVDFIVEYCNEDYKLFEEITGKILIHSSVSTPRQVKKIINTFIENVMIASDREQAGKVGKGFATDKKGLQTIAKISVLQSDYNEFYDLLFKDANAINELLAVHRSSGEREPSELIKPYFDKENMLERKYEPLLNYLIFTENLGYSNMTPYLYMAQTKEGVVVGDKKQQDFVAAIESCNFVTVRQLINESPILTSLFLQELKYDESPMIGNIILSAIDSYDVAPEDNKKELAISIVERIADISNSSSDFRYDLINVENLMEVCHVTDSNEHNRLVECAINREKLDVDHKNRVSLINKLSKIEQELSDITLDKFKVYVKEWIASEESGVQDIIDYTISEGTENIANSYGKEYIQKISKHITENDDFEDILIKQFRDVVSAFLKNNSLMEIIDALEPCYDYPALHKMLDESIEQEKYREIPDLNRIANKIVSVGVSNLKGIYGYNILSKILYKIKEDESKLFDDFFVNTVGETQFADMMKAFVYFNDLDMLPNTVDTLSKYSVEEDGYAPDIRKLLILYSPEQKKKFLDTLESLCQYSTNGEYEIIGELLTELSKEPQYNADMINIIERNIISGVKSYYSKNNYMSFAIRVISAYRDAVLQDDIDEYSSALMKAISTDTENVVNAYRVVNKLISNDIWRENILVLLNYVTKSTYATIYDIVTERIDLFNKESGNLTKLMEFFVDNIRLSNSPDDVINTLSTHFKTIGNFDKLIHELMNIEYNKSNASAKLAKFIDASDINLIVKIISSEWNEDDTCKDKLENLLSKSGKYSRGLLIFCLNENKETISKNDMLLMLSFGEGAVEESNINAFTEIVGYLLSNYFEKDVCNRILLLIGNLSSKVIAKDRERICTILVEIFKKSSSDENRRKCSVLIKDKGFSRKVRSLLDDNEMKQYKAYLE